jgi:hypothetical protein
MDSIEADEAAERKQKQVVSDLEHNWPPGAGLGVYQIASRPAESQATRLGGEAEAEAEARALDHAVIRNDLWANPPTSGAASGVSIHQTHDEAMSQFRQNVATSPAHQEAQNAAAETDQVERKGRIDTKIEGIPEGEANANPVVQDPLAAAESRDASGLWGVDQKKVDELLAESQARVALEKVEKEKENVSPMDAADKYRGPEGEANANPVVQDRLPAAESRDASGLWGVDQREWNKARIQEDEKRKKEWRSIKGGRMKKTTRRKSIKRKSTSKPRKSPRKPRKSLSKSIKRKSTNTGSKKRKSTRKKLSRRRR